jgi:superfamily II DNA or RNA helicase
MYQYTKNKSIYAGSAQTSLLNSTQSSGRQLALNLDNFKVNQVPVTIEYNGALAQISGLEAQHLDWLEQQLSCVNTSTLNSALFVNPNATADQHTTKLFSKALALIPRGLVQKTQDLLEYLGYLVTLNDTGTGLKADPQIQLLDSLRDYQTAAIDKVRVEKVGILQMPTASGKTRTAIAMMLLFPKAEILFTVPRHKLAVQTIAAINEFIPEEIGFIGGGKNKWRRITVGIVNSLALAIERAPEELAKFKIVFHDECQFTGNKSYLTLSQGLVNAEYILGLSATPYRNDGCDLIIEAVCGPIIYIVPETTLAAKGAINLPTYIQITHKDRYQVEGRPYPNTQGRQSLQTILAWYNYAIAEYPRRNQLLVAIIQTMLQLPSRQGGILVLFDYLQHGQTVQEMLRQVGIEVSFITGEVKGVKQRKANDEILEAFKQNQIPLLLGSKVLREGVDLPNLELLLLAGCSSNNVALWQQIGRVLRVNASYNKVRSVVVDVQDSDPYFNKRAQRRWEHVEDRYGDGCAYEVNTLADMCKIINSKT